MTIGMELLRIDEPVLEFRHGQTEVDPHRGLSLFGPYDADLNPPGRVTHGVVGTSEGIQTFASFAGALARSVVGSGLTDDERCDPGVEHDRRKRDALWPGFPGFRTAFGMEWQQTPLCSGEIDPFLIDQALHDRDDHRRAREVVDLFLEQIRIASERENPPRVSVCVVPDQVWLNCRPLSRVNEGYGDRPSKKQVARRRSHGDLFGDYDPEDYDLSNDFRRQIKARALTYRMPIQIVLESTLSLDPGKSRTLTPLTDRAWNLATALYYKAGGRPWRLATVRSGVCYIGITFKRQDPSNDHLRTAACAAQMFLDTGDGIVFRGESGPWYSPQTRDYTLGRAEARKLLEGVLATYREQGGQPLTEVFLHAHSSIAPDDFAGFADACPPGTRIVGIRVRRASETARLYRLGKYPVLRGTTWIVNDRTAFLWTNGFKPHLLTYDGWMVPAPIRIDVQHGTADIRQVAADVLGLTKLNYNACRAGDAMPVTVKFSDRVGEILVANPTVTERQPHFRYYI